MTEKEEIFPKKFPNPDYFASKILGSHNFSLLLTGLYFDFDKRLTEQTADWSESDVNKSVICYHEFIHLLQNVGTYYGIALYTAMKTIKNVVFTAYRSAFKYIRDKEPEEKLPFPLANFSESNCEIIRNVGRELLEIPLWKQLVALQENKVSSLPVDELGLDITFEEKITCSPIVKLDGIKTGITALHLLEGHAQFMQGLYIYDVAEQEQINMKKFKDMLPSSLEYVIAFNYCLSIIGFERIMEFPFIIDCSLNPDISLGFPKTDAQWMQFHPGYRFLNILNKIHNISPPNINATNPAILNKEVTRYYNDIYELAGHNYNDLLDKRESALQDFDKFSDEEEILSNAGVFGLLRFSILRILNNWPWVIGWESLQKDAKLEVRKKLHPIFSIHNGNRYCTIEEKRAIRKKIVLENDIELQALAWFFQLMGGKRDEDTAEIKCGPAFFGCKKTCPANNYCSGSFLPNIGPPIKTLLSDEFVSGCPFLFYIFKEFGIKTHDLAV